MLHFLKCWPEPFQAVVRGEKRHEARVNDRGYKVGDLLRLEEWDPLTKQYSGGTVVVRVTYLTPGGTFGLPADVCVMSIVCEPLPEAPRTEEATCKCPPFCQCEAHAGAASETGEKGEANG